MTTPKTEDSSSQSSDKRNYLPIAGISERETEIWSRIEVLLEKSKPQWREVISMFPFWARRVDMSHFLAHYELFRKTQDLPGHIVECGVFRGTSLLSWAKFLEIFSMGNKGKKAIGFDHFKGLINWTPEDGPQLDGSAKSEGTWCAAEYREEIYEMMEIFQQDCFIPHAERVKIVDGDVLETVPKYVQENPGLRISLLHLDIDLYEPTLCALEHFYPRVVQGGVVVFDEYGLEAWGGESTAAERYFGKTKMPRIKTLPWVSTPSGYFIKGENEG